MHLNCLRLPFTKHTHTLTIEILTDTGFELELSYCSNTNERVSPRLNVMYKLI